jgi:hypothetical protein
MSATRCIYDQPEPATRIDMDGEQSSGEVRLCWWATYAPDAVKLVGMPIWIQRAATSGAYMNDGDCSKCSARKDA